MLINIPVFLYGIDLGVYFCSSGLFLPRLNVKILRLNHIPMTGDGRCPPPPLPTTPATDKAPLTDCIVSNHHLNKIVLNSLEMLEDVQLLKNLKLTFSQLCATVLLCSRLAKKRGEMHLMLEQNLYRIPSISKCHKQKVTKG